MLPASPLDGADAALWSCERCAKTYSDCNYMYNFAMKLSDYSDTLLVSAIGE